MSKKAKESILSAPSRAIEFVGSRDYLQLKSELEAKVNQYKTEILIAGLIENVNIRGRIIEYLIAGEDASRGFSASSSQQQSSNP